MEHHQSEYERIDMLDNGYMMISTDYMHYKNGKIKNHDDDLVLHTPDGRKINCGFLNKFDFTTAGRIIDVATGREEIITEEYAKAMNDINEKKARIAIRKKIKNKNPKVRHAMEQYIRRKRMEADNLMNSVHTVEIRGYTSRETQSFESAPSRVQKEKEDFNKRMKAKIKNFRDR